MFEVSAHVPKPVSYMLMECGSRQEYDYSETVYKIIKIQDGVAKPVYLTGTKSELKELIEELVVVCQ